jgi:hypothetical protein
LGIPEPLSHAEPPREPTSQAKEKKTKIKKKKQKIIKSRNAGYSLNQGRIRLRRICSAEVNTIDLLRPFNLIPVVIAEQLLL